MYGCFLPILRSDWLIASDKNGQFLFKYFRSTNMNNNLDMPSRPSPHFEDEDLSGFTKREQACLTMGVADSGDAELDAIIEQGNRQRLVGLTMQGILATSAYCNEIDCIEGCIEVTEALLQQLKGDV
jgi:hypothetical protein